jgi:hypothetical protein
MTTTKAGPAAATASKTAAGPVTTSSGAALVLAVLPAALRAELISELNGVEQNYREGRWKPAELDGGRLCEVVYSILKGHIDGSYPPSTLQVTNFPQLCRNLENAKGFPQSVRITIPRMLIALYELRNNRGVGHVNGEVDSNHMDAALTVAVAKWLVADLVRLLHNVDTKTATELVDALIERDTPLVWEVNGSKRVLNTKLSIADRTLLTLHATPAPVPESTLRDWVEASNSTRYRRQVLEVLHQRKLVEYDATTRLVTLSPTGRDHVESSLATWILR